MNEYAPNQMQKFQRLKVQVEVICEASDLKMIVDVIVELGKKLSDFL